MERYEPIQVAGMFHYCSISCKTKEIDAMGESGDLNGYASSTFTHACHTLYNIVSKLSNARSLVSKYVLDRFLSRFLWLYEFFNFCEKNPKFSKNLKLNFWKVAPFWAHFGWMLALWSHLQLWECILGCSSWFRVSFDIKLI